MCAPYFRSCSGGLRWGPRACPAMDPPAPPWRRKVGPEGPPWMQQSVQRLEQNRLESISANRKRQREVDGEEDEEIAGDGGTAAAAASSSGGLQLSLRPPASSPSGPQESLPPPRAEDMRRFRHASMTPASFASARRLYMCCSRPMAVRWLMSSPTPPSFLITSLCDASKTGGIRPLCLGLFSGALCLFGFLTRATSRASRLFFIPPMYSSTPWRLLALLTHPPVFSYRVCIHLPPWGLLALSTHMLDRR